MSTLNHQTIEELLRDYFEKYLNASAYSINRSVDHNGYIVGILYRFDLPFTIEKPEELIKKTEETIVQTPFFNRKLEMLSEEKSLKIIELEQNIAQIQTENFQLKSEIADIKKYKDFYHMYKSFQKGEDL